MESRPSATLISVVSKADQDSDEWEHSFHWPPSCSTSTCRSRRNRPSYRGVVGMNPMCGNLLSALHRRIALAGVHSTCSW
jgi:hypothetical protein